VLDFLKYLKWCKNNNQKVVKQRKIAKGIEREKINMLLTRDPEAK
jgi:hypothetical protein